MNELRDLSKLPAEQEYWDRLEARIMGKPVPETRSRDIPRPGPGWWAPLASRGLELGVLAAAAGIAALLLVPPRTRGEVTNPAVLFRLPDDPAMIAFLSSPGPPSLGSLLIRPPRSTP